MAALLLFAAFFVLAVVLIFENRTQYWKRRGIPGPEPSLFVGNVLQLFNYNFPGVFQLREWTKKYGRSKDQGLTYSCNFRKVLRDSRRLAERACGQRYRHAPGTLCEEI
ncbi:hypothetical protein L596_023355 [Steinernema carpocapsae]|uniref:Cytochrome P450 n=1 Tax=Steinernema carpocapsae TaxID=34508 RepID=A0A4U5MDL8_STECR|nr:hypothetical protein L596_023355 [Steinernema carpocapsae]